MQFSEVDRHELSALRHDHQSVLSGARPIGGSHEVKFLRDTSGNCAGGPDAVVFHGELAGLLAGRQ